MSILRSATSARSLARLLASTNRSEQLLPPLYLLARTQAKPGKLLTCTRERKRSLARSLATQCTKRSGDFFASACRRLCRVALTSALCMHARTGKQFSVTGKLVRNSRARTVHIAVRSSPLIPLQQTHLWSSQPQTMRRTTK